jgi:hypothetical protein
MFPFVKELKYYEERDSFPLRFVFTDIPLRKKESQP